MVFLAHVLVKFFLFLAYFILFYFYISYFGFPFFLFCVMQYTHTHTHLANRVRRKKKNKNKNILWLSINSLDLIFSLFFFLTLLTAYNFSSNRENMQENRK